MPTPIVHLRISNEILDRDEVSRGDYPPLPERAGDFLFGSIAPDVRAINDMSREETHFFHLPPRLGENGVEAMLEKYPQLADPLGLSSPQAAFVAGYLSHLLVDEIWLAEIFIPYFGHQLDYGTFDRRMVLHNVLRIYVDVRERDRLEGTILQRLKDSTIEGLLPFVPDEDLEKWRDLICRQLIPGASVKTVEFFASRMDVPEAVVEELLTSPERLRYEVLNRLPPGKLAEFRRKAMECSCQLIKEYLRGRLLEKKPIVYKDQPEEG